MLGQEVVPEFDSQLLPPEPCEQIVFGSEQPLLSLTLQVTQILPSQYGVEENLSQSSSTEHDVHEYEGEEMHLDAVTVVHPLLSLVLQGLQVFPSQYLFGARCAQSASAEHWVHVYEGSHFEAVIKVHPVLSLGLQVRQVPLTQKGVLPPQPELSLVLQATQLFDSQ